MRQTSQRTRIKKVLAEANKHYNADDIFELVNQDQNLKAISKATVYRALNSMYEQKEILKIMKGNVAYFDGNISKHYHFICEKCHEIIDVNYPGLDDFEDFIQSNYNVKVSGYEINVTGICEKCLREGEKSNGIKRK